MEFLQFTLLATGVWSLVIGGHQIKEGKNGYLMAVIGGACLSLFVTLGG